MNPPRSRNTTLSTLLLVLLGAILIVLLGSSQATAAAWLSPADLSGPDREAESPQVALAPGGEAIAIWSRSDGTNFIVEAATRPVGGSFSTPVKLSPGGANASGPQIALTSGGEAIAIWSRSDGAKLIVEAATRPPGGSFAAPVKLSAAGQSAFEPKIALDQAGDAIAVWSRFDGTNFIIEAATRPPAGSFSAPVKLSAAGQDAIEPGVALDAAGDAIATWSRSDGATFVVEAATRPPGGSFSASVKLSPADEDAVASQIAIDAGGDAIAVWRDIDGSRVEAATRPAGHSFSAASTLPGTGHGINDLRVAIDALGDGIAVWRRSEAGRRIVQAALYDATPPQLRSPSIPSVGTAGQPISFRVTPFDAFSNPSVTWGFGDGAKQAPGAGVTHTYAAPGTYKVTLTATDGAGNATSTSSTIRVDPGHPKAIAARIAKVRGKKAILSLRCPPTGPCQGTAKLSAKKRTLGKRTFRIAAGKSLNLAIGLSTPARRLLKAAGRKGLVAQLSGPGLEPAKVRLKG